MIQFSQSQERILLALATFKYLTVSQLLELEVMKSKRSVSKKVKELKDRRFIESIAYGFTPKIGRVENVNFLNKKGKEVLMQGLGIEESEIRMPISTKNLFFKDYFHRGSTIDFHIHLHKWTEENDSYLAFFDTYFDKLGNNRTSKNLRAKTKVDIEDGYIIPDGLFLLELPNNEQELYLLEVYYGKDTSRTVKQLTKHVQAMELGSVNEKYKFEKAYRVLSVFEQKSIQEAVMQRMAKDKYFTHFKDHFYFKSLEEIHHSHLMEDWQNFEGEKKAILTVPIQETVIEQIQKF